MLLLDLILLEMKAFLSDLVIPFNFFSSLLGFLDLKYPVILKSVPRPVHVLEFFFATSLLCSLSLILTDLVVLPVYCFTTPFFLVEFPTYTYPDFASLEYFRYMLFLLN